MGNTQQLNLRNKQRSIRFSRGFRPATVALMVAIGVSGCAGSGKQIKAYQPPQAQPVAASAAAPASNAEVVITTELNESSAIQVRADSPREYEVVKGDTLWDISGKFLHDPYQWPSIWKQNPQIANPHLIYPGDLIRLSVVDGRAVIDVLRPNGEGGYSSVGGGEVGAAPRMRNGREVMSPMVREEDLVRSVSNEAAEAIRNFAKSPHVMVNDELQDAAYVLGTIGERLAAANGDEIYARGFPAQMQEIYSVFRPSEPLIDPDTGVTLGYEATRVADALVVRAGDPATLELFNSAIETLKGDRLVAKSNEEMDNPVPVAVDPSVNAKVISLYDAMARAGLHQVVVLNKGRNGGMVNGSTLEIASAHTAVFDDLANAGEGEYVELPERIKGNAIVFRTFDNVSYALILEATVPVQVGDTMRGF